MSKKWGRGAVVPYYALHLIECTLLPMQKLMTRLQRKELMKVL